MSDPLLPVWFVVVIGLACGAATGSFAACAAYRLPRRMSLWGRSACPACGAQIPARHNLPVLSWLFLRGRSRCCAQPLSLSYLLYEAGCAALGMATGLTLHWALPLAAAILLPLLCLLVSHIRGVASAAADEPLYPDRDMVG